MPIAAPGQTTTFQTQWLDVTNTPIVVTDPTIEIFTFDNSGSKVTLVTAGTPMVAVSGDTGRYAFTYTLQDPWGYQPTVYGLMRATYMGDTLLVQSELDITPTATTTGMVAQFVRGG